MSFDKVRAAAAATTDAPPKEAPVQAPPAQPASTPPAAPPPPPLPTSPDEYVGHWFADLLNTAADVATGLSKDGSVASEDRLGESTTLMVTTYTPIKFKRGSGAGGPMPAWRYWLGSVFSYTWHAVTRSSKGVKAWIVDGWEKLRERAKAKRAEAEVEQPAVAEPAAEPAPGVGPDGDAGFEQGPRPEKKKRGRKS